MILGGNTGVLGVVSQLFMNVSKELIDLLEPSLLLP